MFSTDDAADVGADESTPVTGVYKTPAKFTGKIAKGTIEVQEMKTGARNEAEEARKMAALKKALAD